MPVSRVKYSPYNVAIHAPDKIHERTSFYSTIPHHETPGQPMQYGKYGFS